MGMNRWAQKWFQLKAWAIDRVWDELCHDNQRCWKIECDSWEYGFGGGNTAQPIECSLCKCGDLTWIGNTYIYIKKNPTQRQELRRLRQKDPWLASLLESELLVQWETVSKDGVYSNWERHATLISRLHMHAHIWTCPHKILKKKKGFDVRYNYFFTICIT